MIGSLKNEADSNIVVAEQNIYSYINYVKVVFKKNRDTGDYLNIKEIT